MERFSPQAMKHCLVANDALPLAILICADQGESVLIEPNIDVVAAARAFVAAGPR
jgi:hypothetical protein